MFDIIFTTQTVEILFTALCAICVVGFLLVMAIVWFALDIIFEKAIKKMKGNKNNAGSIDK